MNGRTRSLRLLAGLVAVAAVVWAWRSPYVAERLSLEGMRTLVGGHGPWGPLVYIVACAAGIVLHLPQVVLIALGGMLFESHLAFVYVWVAVLLGTTAVFLFVRYAARERVQRLVARRFTRLHALDERLAARGIGTVAFLRLTLFLAPPLTWALGTTHVRLGHYLAGTAVGIVPGVAAIVFFADAIVSREPGDAFGVGRAVIGGVLMVVLLVAGLLASRRVLDGPRPPVA